MGLGAASERYLQRDEGCWGLLAEALAAPGVLPYKILVPVTLDQGSVYTAHWALTTPVASMALQPLVLLGLFRLCCH